MAWSLGHHDTVFSDSLVFSLAVLPHSAQREQLVNIVFYCHRSVGDPVIGLLHITLIPSLGKNYDPACLYLVWFEYMRPVILLPIAEEVKGEFDLECKVKRVSSYPVFLPISHLHLPKPRPSLRASTTLPPTFPAIYSLSLLPPGTKTCSQLHGRGPGTSKGAVKQTWLLPYFVLLPGMDATEQPTVITCSGDCWFLLLT